MSTSPTLLATSFYAGPAAFAVPVDPSVLEDRNEVITLASAVGFYCIHLDRRGVAPNVPIRLLQAAKKLRTLLFQDTFPASQAEPVREELAEMLLGFDGDVSHHFRAVRSAKHSIQAVFGMDGKTNNGELAFADALFAGAGHLLEFSEQQPPHDRRALHHFVTLASALIVHFEDFGIDHFLRLGLLKSGCASLHYFAGCMMRELSEEARRRDYEDALSLIRHGGTILASSIQTPSGA